MSKMFPKLSIGINFNYLNWTPIRYQETLDLFSESNNFKNILNIFSDSKWHALSKNVKI